MLALKKWFVEKLVPKSKKISELDYVMALNTMFSKNNILFLSLGLLTIVLLITQSFSWIYSEQLRTIILIGIRCYVLSIVFLTSYEYASKKLRYFEAMPVSVQNVFLFSILSFFSNQSGINLYFISLLFPLISIQIILFIEKYELLVKLPKKVPSAAANMINQVIPVFITLLLLLGIHHATIIVLRKEMMDIIASIAFLIAKKIDTWFIIVLLMLFTQLLWSIGIHGGSVTGFITNTFYTYNMLYNLECFILQKEMPFTMTNTVSVYAVVIGGAGATLSLALLMCRSKSKHLQDVSQAGLYSSFFGINEPILYATPLIHNKLFNIPFIITPLLNIMIVYLMTSMRIITKTFIPMPWAFPSFLALPISMWNRKAFYLIIIIILVDGLIYYPFFKKYEKQLLEKEGEI